MRVRPEGAGRYRITYGQIAGGLIILAIISGVWFGRRLLQSQPLVDIVTDLDSTSWLLTEINGQPALSDVALTATIQDGEITGFDRCNAYHINPSPSIFYPNGFGKTLVYCFDDAGDQSRSFLSLMSRVKRYRLSGDTLRLEPVVGPGYLIFEQVEVGIPVDLALAFLDGSQWELIEMNGWVAEPGWVVGHPLSIIFEDGWLNGYGGCNQFWGTIGMGATDGFIRTGMGCDCYQCDRQLSILDQEDMLMDMLEVVKHYRRSGDTLRMENLFGPEYLIFELVEDSE